MLLWIRRGPAARHGALGIMLMLGAAMPTGGSAQPYQPSFSKTFPFAVTIPGLPTMYVSNPHLAGSLKRYGKDAIDAIEHCDRSRFNEDLWEIEGRLVLGGRAATEDLKKDQAAPSPTLGYGDIFVGAMSTLFRGVDPNIDINNPGPKVSPATQTRLSDVNTVASVMVLLKQKSWDHCRPPTSAPPPPVRTPKPRAATETGYVFPSRPTGGFYVGGSFGGMGRTTTFDDGGKLHSGTGLFEADFGFVQFPLAAGGASRFFVAPQVGIGVPFGGVADRGFETQLQVYGTAELHVGAVLNLSPSLPMSIFVGGGGALGSVRSASSLPGFAYSDTRTLGGFTLSAGASVPLTPRLDAIAGFRYLNLGFESFPTPGGGFRQREEAVIGSVGFRVKL